MKKIKEINSHSGLRNRVAAMRFLVPVVLALILIACSGGGSGESGGGDPAAIGSVNVSFDEGRSGYVLLTSGGGYTAYHTDDASSNHTDDITAGDGVFGQSERGFLSFNFTVPQEMQEVLSATLFVHVDRYANEPYDSLGGELNVYGVTYGGLDGLDYLSAPEEGKIVISTDKDNVDEWLSVDVTTAVKNDWSGGASRTQFMLRFPDANDGDINPDRIFLNGDESSSDYPYLRIEYR